MMIINFDLEHLRKLKSTIYQAFYCMHRVVSYFTHHILPFVISDRGTDPPPAKRHKLATLPKDLLDRWRKLLVDRYLVEESSSDTWPPLKIVQFIEFALVRQSKEADHIGLKTVSGNIDEIYGDKTKIRNHVIKILIKPSLTCCWLG